MRLTRQTRRRFLGIATALAGVALLASALPGQAAFPGANGRIAFERGDELYVGGTEAIWTMRPDGSHRRIVFRREGGQVGQPEISPSGRRIAFLRGSGIWVMTSDGTRVRRLARGSANQPAFSPNGRLIAYTSRKGPGRRIFVTSPSGEGGRQAVTRFRGSHGEPAFVGNRRIVYTSFAGLDEGTDLYSIRLDGTHRRNLTEQLGDVSAYAPDVAPNRSRVAFLEEVKDEICVMKLDRSRDPRCLTPAGADPEELMFAKFSPNGDDLLFWEWRNGVFRMNRDGSGVTRLTKSGARAPDWGPRPR